MDKIVTQGRVLGTITPPSSKSYAQRAIAAALLGSGTTVLSAMELCNDTEASLGVARALGAKISKQSEHVYRIEGGLSPVGSRLNIGESGLATRLFTPIAALCRTPITITGTGSIMSRPIDMMIEPLRSLGAKVQSADGFLPITVCGTLLGGETSVDGSVSSQFLTGLLMALPLAQGDTVLKVGKLNSIPYIEMTIHLAESFGVRIEHNGFKEFFIEGGQRYTPREYCIEGDWSGASCMLVAGAVAGEVTLNNLNPLSLQADVAIIDALVHAGAEITSTTNSVTVERRELHAFDFDATHCPDLFPALAALAANCNGVSTITGTNRLTHKESNRAVTIRDEFEKLGIDVDISQHNLMRITGGRIRGAKVISHNDHRIAMAAAVMALNSDSQVVIEQAESVNKSYPKFWDELDMLKTE